MREIDLHGMTVHAAWRKYRNTTVDCYQKQVKKITVITGHGQMSAEFYGWVSADPFAIRCERQNPNTGSWTVYIKKNTYIKPQPKPQPIELDLKGLYRKFNK